MKIKYLSTIFLVLMTLNACSSYNQIEPKAKNNTSEYVSDQGGKYEQLQRKNYLSVEEKINTPANQGTENYIKSLVMDLVLKMTPYPPKLLLVDTRALQNTSYTAIKSEKIDMIISLFYKELTEFGIKVDEKSKENDNNHIKTVLEIQIIKEDNNYNIICFIKENNSNTVYHVVNTSLPTHLIEHTKDGVPTYL